MMVVRFVLLAVLAAPFLLGCEDPCPDTATLQAELDGAGAGGVVTLGACTVAGPLTVPPGVTLEGRGPTSVVRGGDRTVTLDTEGAEATRLRDLNVESSGCAGVVATGSGEARLERVEVVVSRGVGVASEASGLALDTVTMQGPVRAADLAASTPALAPFVCGGEAATHGLVVIDGTFEANAVDIQGFQAFGALLIRATTTWTGGEVRANLGAGLEVVGGAADLRDLTLAEASFGTAAIEAYDGIFVQGARITSERLTAEGGSTYGLFHEGAEAAHTDLTVRSNGFAGVWSQGGGTLTLTGANVVDNAFASVATFDNPAVRIADSTLSETRTSVGIFGLRTVTAADGLHLIRSAGRVEGTALRANARVGMLLDLDGGSTDAYAFDGVTVDGTGTELGAIAQNGTVSAGWDDAVERLGDTPVNDLAVSTPLDIAGAVGPPCLPPVDGLASGGFGSLIGR